ncbi:thiamine pyrophosphate-binding protein [Parapusillimonas granuli]|uniref:Thiamine pyrophosphate-binding protein n=1 Tax=Parapusillimonas granuli TaxID=380911 RepID=A0A853FU15_9BURK|nr:thiamine pyrophosphate-binding protein [Parapusillimonas granuli]MBB5215126.1 acetolactate synthase-1/2/3 large subunit [Parapusillimonas granuli]MEB2401433.1 thiamine pyrophosphate-binding protein [Alcaligenaceae bacterium]NYT49444.1 thiamine pyrophosphate-binding protein [Parapusillimonas granuli]
MSEGNGLRTGGQVLVDALRLHGADTAYCVPGESFLAVLDALYEFRDEFRLIVCRQEGGAAHMAEAHGKLTGRPGICFVTRGPGSTNASIAIHTARQDSTPLIVFVGQVGRDCMGREAWQEIDYRHMFGHIAKWVEQIDDPRRIPEFISRAFHVATSGRPGPVVLALPEDMLVEPVAAASARPFRAPHSAPAVADMLALAAALESAERPMMILGGGGWTREAGDDIGRFAAAFDLPVACAFRRQDLLDNRHDSYVGEAGLGMNPKLAARIKEADLILAVGARLGETTTSGYSLLDVPCPAQRFLHVHPDPNELGRVYQAELSIVAATKDFAKAAAALEPGRKTPAWGAWTRAARRDYLDFLAPEPMDGAVNLGEIVKHLSDTLPADSIITNGAGNYTLWVQRHYQYRGLRTQMAPTSGTMGYGVPAAIASKVVHPDKTVVCFAGDGCFLMNGQELATAIQYGLDPVFIVVNNGMYGSIRMHQERHYPRRVHGTDLVNPDFVALARSYGAYAERVERTEDFAPAFERARASGRAALLELRVSQEALSPRLTITGLRGA